VGDAQRADVTRIVVVFVGGGDFGAQQGNVDHGRPSQCDLVAICLEAVLANSGAKCRQGATQGGSGAVG
jgi:hypothetical protein